MRGLYNFGNGTINWVWRVLFFLTLFFALTSPNIIIGDNDTFGTSTTLVTTSLVIILVAIAIVNYAYPSIHAWFVKVFVTHQYRTASLILVLVLAGQIFFIHYVHPVSGFDAGMLHYAATAAKNTKEIGVTSYYSLNQNNMPIMLFMHWLAVVGHQISWEYFDYITMAFVDLSAIFNILSIAVLRPRLTGVAMYMQAAWLAVYPSIIMPYTDSWSLPLVSFMFLCYVIMHSQKIWLIFRGPAALGFGVSAVLTYFMKPSAIVPVIAIVVIELLEWLVVKRHFTVRGFVLTGVALLLVGASAGVTYKVTKRTIDDQTYIQIDKSRNIPPIHFMAMGVYGQGGYSEQQAQRMAGLPSEKAKSDYSKKMLVKRLKKLGVFGYAKFLVFKQRNNTADGTFGWLKEGHFFRDNMEPSNKGISNKIKNYIYLYGRHIADFRFVAQLWWIVLLSTIALGFGPHDKMIQVLRLSMVGGFMFLLMFEGGRSRYLIQYLPALLMLFTLSSERAVANVRHLFGWYEKEVTADKAAADDSLPAK